MYIYIFISIGNIGKILCHLGEGFLVVGSSRGAENGGLLFVIFLYQSYKFLYKEHMWLSLKGCFIFLRTYRGLWWWALWWCSSNTHMPWPESNPPYLLEHCFRLHTPVSVIEHKAFRENIMLTCCQMREGVHCSVCFLGTERALQFVQCLHYLISQLPKR